MRNICTIQIKCLPLWQEIGEIIFSAERKLLIFKVKYNIEAKTINLSSILKGALEKGCAVLREL